MFESTWKATRAPLAIFFCQKYFAETIERSGWMNEGNSSDPDWKRKRPLGAINWKAFQ